MNPWRFRRVWRVLCGGETLRDGSLTSKLSVQNRSEIWMPQQLSRAAKLVSSVAGTVALAVTICLPIGLDAGLASCQRRRFLLPAQRSRPSASIGADVLPSIPITTIPGVPAGTASISALCPTRRAISKIRPYNGGNIPRTSNGLRGFMAGRIRAGGRRPRIDFSKAAQRRPAKNCLSSAPALDC